MSSVEPNSTSEALPRLPLPSEMKRNVKDLSWPGRGSPLSAFRGAALVLRRVNRHRELRDVAAFGDLAYALLVDLVDAQHVVHRQVRSLDARKLEPQPLLRRIDDDALACVEHELFDLDETEQR